MASSRPVRPVPCARAAPWALIAVALGAGLGGAGCTASRAYFSDVDAMSAVVTTEIDAASDRVRLAIYTFTDENIQNALIDASARGVSVMVAADAGQSTTISDQIGVLTNLREGGVEVRIGDGYGGGILHHKFLVVDGSTVLTGSFNYTRAANETNDENLVVLSDANLAGAYEDAFADVWARAQE